MREAVSCLAGQVSLVQDSVGSTKPFALELDCDVASSGRELVSVFCPSALVGRDLHKAGHDAQLSLTKTLSGSFFSFLFCLRLGHPTWMCECKLLLSSRADLLVPFKTGSISKACPSTCKVLWKGFPIGHVPTFSQKIIISNNCKY